MRGTDHPFVDSFLIVVTCRFINRSVSLSPLYLIHLLILHPRTNSKNGLCDLCVRPIPNSANGKTNTKTEWGEEKYKKNNLFNKAKIFKLASRSTYPAYHPLQRFLLCSSPQ